MADKTKNRKVIEFFKDVDKNKDKLIDRKELEGILLQNGFTNVEAEVLFKSIDLNGDGKIDLQEFLASFEVAE